MNPLYLDGRAEIVKVRFYVTEDQIDLVSCADSKTSTKSPTSYVNALCLGVENMIFSFAFTQLVFVTPIFRY